MTTVSGQRPGRVRLRCDSCHQLSPGTPVPVPNRRERALVKQGVNREAFNSSRLPGLPWLELLQAGWIEFEDSEGMLCHLCPEHARQRLREAA